MMLENLFDGLSFFVHNVCSTNLMWKLYLTLYIITTCILGVIIGKNGKNIDDIMNKSLVNRIIKVDQADVSVVMLLT